MNATPQAIDELKRVLNSEENPLVGVRIFTQNGCCGPSLQMSVAENVSTGDKLITLNSVNFYISPSAEEMINGVTLDFGPNGFRLDGLITSEGCCGKD